MCLGRIALGTGGIWLPFIGGWSRYPSSSWTSSFWPPWAPSAGVAYTSAGPGLELGFSKPVVWTTDSFSTCASNLINDWIAGQPLIGKTVLSRAVLLPVASWKPSMPSLHAWLGARRVAGFSWCWLLVLLVVKCRVPSDGTYPGWIVVKAMSPWASRPRMNLPAD